MLNLRIGAAVLAVGGVVLAAPGARAQRAESRLTLSAGVGNGLGAGAAYERGPWLLLARTRYKWWIPREIDLNPVFSRLNSRSRQAEAALLLGRALTAGAHRFHAAAGVAFLAGRNLGDYRYTLRRSGLFSSPSTDYFAYQRYTALGLPLELGWQVQLDELGVTRLGLTAQGNLNPQHRDLTLLATLAFAIPLADPR
ncbi:hypothetical protein LJ737_18930 [Hymenobacter sp. 15J16-1T3B]|uniref:hypothetical protein n=1 Tax=Hymenobacter sp. 15J16-1T3B TaxID=2886941 RepID=UPI001D1079AE|nr:hypothetical protein [Hymenobacter sp. 15J16-1T3B]MCC3159324.1 hypothetical protein [Hymenobacter sp. 15J16-1T3B]